jgi:hypothetical protein
MRWQRHDVAESIQGHRFGVTGLAVAGRHRDGRLRASRPRCCAKESVGPPPAPIQGAFLPSVYGGRAILTESDPSAAANSAGPGLDPGLSQRQAGWIDRSGAAQRIPAGIDIPARALDPRRVHERGTQ